MVMVMFSRDGSEGICGDSEWPIAGGVFGHCNSGQELDDDEKSKDFRSGFPADWTLLSLDRHIGFMVDGHISRIRNSSYYNIFCATSIASI
jgi:hypothetical protein